MPATISQQPIPVPTQDNLVAVVNAIRNVLISMSNTDAGRASQSGSIHTGTVNQPSQFVLQSEVIVPVTYSVPIVGGTGTASVTIPQLTSLSLINRISGQVWTWTAPSNLTRNGIVGQPLS